MNKKQEVKKALDNLAPSPKIKRTKNNKEELKKAINKLDSIYKEILPILTNNLKTIKNENLLQ